MRKLILYCFFVLAVQISMAQTSRLITKNQAFFSIDWCLRMLDSIHPNMYYYTSKQVVDSVIDKIKNKCLLQPGDSIDVDWFLAELTRCNYLWDSHTRIWGNRLVYKTSKIFPPIWWREDNKVFLLGEKFQITSINDISIDTITNYLNKYVGQGADQKARYITWTIGPMFQYCLNDHHILPPYSVRGIDSTGHDVVKIVEGKLEREVKNYRWHGTAKIFGFPSNTSGDIFWGFNKPYQFKVYPQESIAIMRYDEFFLPEDYPEIYSLVHDFFATCEKQQIKYLFFDISRNPGGVLGSFDILGSYLSFKKSATYKVKYVRKESVNWENENIENRKKCDLKPYRGQIFVYQSYYSASAAPVFAAIMKVTTNALLVGTCTGQGGIPSFGLIRTYDIPFTDGELTIPRVLFSKERPRLDRLSQGALLPDIQYPFVLSRRLNLEDCLEIIKLGIKNN